MGQPPGRDWAAAWAERIGSNITRLRKEKGLSAQKLSDRCAEVGYPIPRSTIANIESGRKRDIPVQEVAVIARALQVAPLRILYHAGEPTLDVVPGVARSGLEAAEWFSGNWPIFREPGFSQYQTLERWKLEDSDNEALFASEEVGELWVYRHYQIWAEQRQQVLLTYAEASAAVEDIEQGRTPVQVLYDPKQYGHLTKEVWQSLADNAERALGEIEREMSKLVDLLDEDDDLPPVFNWGTDV